MKIFVGEFPYRFAWRWFLALIVFIVVLVSVIGVRHARASAIPEHKLLILNITAVSGFYFNSQDEYCDIAGEVCIPKEELVLRIIEYLKAVGITLPDDSPIFQKEFFRIHPRHK
jgi:hypothetical protein